MAGLVPSVSIRDNYENYISYVSGRLLRKLRICRCPESHDTSRCLSAGLDAEGGPERKSGRGKQGSESRLLVSYQRRELSFLFSYEQEWSSSILVPDRSESGSILVPDRSGTVSFLISHDAGTGVLVSDCPRSSLLVPYTGCAYTGCAISAQVGQKAESSILLLGCAGIERPDPSRKTTSGTKTRVAKETQLNLTNSIRGFRLTRNIRFLYPGVSEL